MSNEQNFAHQSLFIAVILAASAAESNLFYSER
jgi:hypothetical protein